MQARLSDGIGGKVLKISGPIDSDAQFPSLGLGSGESLTINFEEVDLITSIGIQTWMKFIKTIPEDCPVTIMFCPPCIVWQINS